MQMESLEQQTIADNLANIATGGFKAARNTYSSYKDQAITNTASSESVGSLSRGVAPYNTTYDFKQGALTPTGNPLDIAINGSGFFPIQSSEGQVEFTRNAHFGIDKDGFVANQQGQRLLDQGFAPIYIGVTGVRDVSILRSGELYVNSQYNVTLAAFDFPQTAAVVRTSGDKFKPYDSEVTMNKALNTTFQQGFIEASNVSSIKATSDMIQVLRSHEANQKVFRAEVETLNSLMDVGRI
jgi:flagellar basal body rod protein FlgG